MPPVFVRPCKLRPRLRNIAREPNGGPARLAFALDRALQLNYLRPDLFHAGV